MDSETKIYLDNLVEAVKELNSPDWWTIGITAVVTVVNAAIMIWIAWKQYKLQQRQNKIQEHESFKDLYKLISDIHYKSKYFLAHIHYNLCNGFADWYVKQQHKELLELQKTLSFYEIDLKLKARISDQEYVDYRMIVDEMDNIIFLIDLYVRRGVVDISNFNKVLDFLEDKEYISDILGNITEPNREEIKDRFKFYSKLKTDIQKYDSLYFLRKCCTL